MKNLKNHKIASQSVVCPYYKQEDRWRIYCEGFSPYCFLQTTFVNHEELEFHKQIYCNCHDGYPLCPLYPAINDQYEPVKRP